MDVKNIKAQQTVKEFIMYLIGQNFRRTKYFVGQNFRHQAKISTLLSDEFLSDKVLSFYIAVDDLRVG